MENSIIIAGNNNFSRKMVVFSKSVAQMLFFSLDLLVKIVPNVSASAFLALYERRNRKYKHYTNGKRTAS